MRLSCQSCGTSCPWGCLRCRHRRPLRLLCLRPRQAEREQRRSRPPEWGSGSEAGKQGQARGTALWSATLPGATTHADAGAVAALRLRIEAQLLTDPCFRAQLLEAFPLHPPPPPCLSVFLWRGGGALGGANAVGGFGAQAHATWPEHRAAVRAALLSAAGQGRQEARSAPAEIQRYAAAQPEQQPTRTCVHAGKQAHAAAGGAAALPCVRPGHAPVMPSPHACGVRTHLARHDM